MEGDEAEERISAGTSLQAQSLRTVYCNGCGKGFESEDDYLDHVFENQECHKAYLASEKREMSKM